MKHFYTAVAGSLLLAFGAASAPASASITIGTPNGGNCFPFGCSGTPGTRYQQVWDSSAFDGALTISSIAFVVNSGSALNGGTFTLSLSTTASLVNGIDDMPFDDNVGADDTVIYSGTLAGQFDGTTLLFDGFSFAYDPSAGNLLLDVNVVGSGGGGSFFEAMNGDATQFSRAHDFGAEFDNWGLVATFNGAIPEPATWGLMIAGFGLVGYAARRRRTLVAN